ncbi:unnamed protein product [Vicia faba]|uniref:Uncharacterized protein n=1 Tax=Vicia faba TaxID=3906 RepID=A0AAV0ZYS7_VICFA|nr:unnamed protein product [Vicia faba]
MFATLDNRCLKYFWGRLWSDTLLFFCQRGGGGRGNGPSSTFCSWHGVTCGGGGRGNGRVVSLNVTGLRGGELASSIGELSELRVLSIPENIFFGEIPVSLMNLRGLEVLELQGERVVSRVLSATNEEGRVKGENSIEHVTYEEDAIDADDNDERLTKSSNASDKAFEVLKEFCCNGTVVEDPELGQVCLLFFMPTNPKTSLDCSIDTGLFVTGSYDHYVNVWDTNTTQVVVNFKMPDKLELRMYKFGFVNCDIASGAFAHTLSGHRDGVMTVEWSASSEWVLITGGCDGAIRFWDIRHAGCFQVLNQSRTQLGRRPPILKRSSITKESSTKMHAAQKKFVNGSGSGQLPIGRLSSRGPMKQKLQSSQVKGNGCNQVKQW